MEYRIFDTQLQDYVAPYKEDEKYWTLEEARGLAYRRMEEVCESEENEQQRNESLDYLAYIADITTEAEVAKALSWFDYVLEGIE